MKLLIVLTYCRPHTSGLTIYAERLAKAMVRRGHQVTVLTSGYFQYFFTSFYVMLMLMSGLI